MAYDTTEAVAKFLSGFQMKITNRERDTVAPDYYVKYLLTLSKGGSQFVSRYYMTDLLEDNSIAVSLDTMLKNGNPFSLDGGIPAWTVEGDDLAKVNAFLKETCKKVFGILPGADADGYSLSGEAKEAALSRFALPENRKAALDMIRKLNESRDSNENDLF